MSPQLCPETASEHQGRRNRSHPPKGYKAAQEVPIAAAAATLRTEQILGLYHTRQANNFVMIARRWANRHMSRIRFLNK
jgi:hypothetical protein